MHMATDPCYKAWDEALGLALFLGDYDEAMNTEGRIVVWGQSLASVPGTSAQ